MEFAKVASSYFTYITKNYPNPTIILLHHFIYTSLDRPSGQQFDNFFDDLTAEILSGENSWMRDLYFFLKQ